MKSPLEEDGRDEPREAGVDTFSILQFVEEASRKGQTVIKELDEPALFRRGGPGAGKIAGGGAGDGPQRAQRGPIRAREIGKQEDRLGEIEWNSYRG